MFRKLVKSLLSLAALTLVSLGALQSPAKGAAFYFAFADSYLETTALPDDVWLIPFTFDDGGGFAFEWNDAFALAGGYGDFPSLEFPVDTLAIAFGAAYPADPFSYAESAYYSGVYGIIAANFSDSPQDVGFIWHADVLASTSIDNPVYDFAYAYAQAGIFDAESGDGAYIYAEAYNGGEFGFNLALPFSGTLDPYTYVAIGLYSYAFGQAYSTPEPGAVALLGAVGVLGAGFLVRRRRRK